MTGEAWRVDPAGVDAVVTRTAGPVADVVEARAALHAAFATASASSASGAVAAALDEFATHFAPLLAGVSTSLASARTAASAASSTYVAAGAEIAGNVESEAAGASRSPFDGRFSGSRGRGSVTAR
jgi:hypothetical protein